MTENVKNKKKPVAKRFRSPLFLTVSTLAAAIILVAATFVVLYALGFRYLRKDFSDKSYIKFVGRTSDGVTPVSGKLWYSDGRTATVDGKTGVLTYSDGSTYEGGLSELQWSGKGKKTFANGDVYTGGWKNGRIC